MNITAYKLILAHGLQQRRNDQGWRTLGIVAALVFAAALVVIIWGSAQGARFVGGNLLMMVVAIFWGGLVVNLLLQNQPNAARLVPGHVARLREVLVAGWLLASLLMTVALVVMTGPSCGRACPCCRPGWWPAGAWPRWAS